MVIDILGARNAMWTASVLRRLVRVGGVLRQSAQAEELSPDFGFGQEIILGYHSRAAARLTLSLG